MITTIENDRKYKKNKNKHGDGFRKKLRRGGGSEEGMGKGGLKLTNGVKIPISAAIRFNPPPGPRTSSSFSFRPMVKLRRRRREMLGFSEE